MTDKSQQPKGQDGVLSTLNLAIDGLNLAREVATVTPAEVAFGAVAILVTMIRVSPFSPATRDRRLMRNQDTMVNERDYVELGLFCTNICKALERGMGDKTLDGLSKSVCDAINQLIT